MIQNLLPGNLLRSAACVRRTRRHRWLGLLLLGLGLAVPGFAQSFVAEWNAASDGGIGPTGLALATENGTAFLYVADQPRGRVVKFNTTTGAVAGTIGRQGNANGEFNSPYGLAFDPASGDLYVAERGNNRISRVTKAGAFVMAWGAAGTADGQFTAPVGVAVDAAGDVYVTDHGNNRVQKFHVAQSGGTWTATHLLSWGSAGAGNGQFNQPYGITADAAGNIWVADGFNGRVQRFNTTGAYQSSVGSAGTAAGQFVIATWLSLDANGDLLISSTNSDPQNAAAADLNNQWISRFTSAGTFVSRFGGTYGQAGGQFKLPFASVVGPSNRLYVSDYYNTRVQVFDLAGTPPPAGGTGTGGAGGTGTGGADTTPPAVANFVPGATTATSVAFQITFSEPVTGVDAADFAAVTTGGATATIGAVTGSGAAYTVPVTFTGTGTIQLNLKPSGTGIADAAGNAIAAGATGPTFTIPAGGGAGTGTGGGSTPPPATVHVVSITAPANGTYHKGQELNFVLRFSGNVSVNVRGEDSGRKGKGDDDDDDDDEDAAAFFTWTAVGSTGGHNLSGKVSYQSGSGTSALTFRYKVKNGDLAPTGIALGTVLQLGERTTIRDAAGATLPAAQLALTWTENPLRSVILDAPKTSSGKEKDDHSGNANNNGRGNDRLSNLSSRLRVTGGDASRSVIAGFVVSGTAPKPILIRAVGPGLAGFGIRDALAAPRLQLRDSTGKLVAENDGWNNRLEVSVAGDRVGAFKLTPGSRDAALLVALAPGAYTAQVTSNGNGVALLEVYDGSTGDQIVAEQIVNISTRGFVGAGEDTIVAGFVITGSSPRQVLIRGIGPGLTALGVNGALGDPVVKLYAASGSAPIAQNDNWQTAQPIAATQVVATGAEITTATAAVGAFPLAAGSKDSALLLTLAPGNYTAVMSGAGGATGAALIEVYEVR